MTTKQQQERLLKAQKELTSFNINGLIIKSASDLYYLAQLPLSATVLITSKKGYVFAPALDLQMVQSLATPIFTVLEDSPLQWEKTIKKHRLKRIGFDSNSFSYEKFLESKKKVSSINKSYKGQGLRCQLIACPSPLTAIRTIKDSSELRILEKAAKLGSEGFDYVISLLTPGITEKEIAQQLQLFWLERGADGVSFPPIIAFGTNTAKPHHLPSNRKLKKGHIVLIDIGVCYKNYCSDMTRVAFFGKTTKTLKKIYSIVLEAQQQALKLCQPGITIADIDNAARSVIEQKGYGEAFFHGLGHGVGIDIHEWPNIRNNSTTKKQTLQEGMVITIEPGIYLPGIGGVRIEDTIAITAKGYKNLTNRPKDLLFLS